MYASILDMYIHHVDTSCSYMFIYLQTAEQVTGEKPGGKTILFGLMDASPPHWNAELRLSSDLKSGPNNPRTIHLLLWNV